MDCCPYDLHFHVYRHIPSIPVVSLVRQKNIARFLSNSEFITGLFDISILQTFIFEEKSNVLMAYNMHSEKACSLKSSKGSPLILFLFIKMVLQTHLKTSSYFEYLNV